MKACAYADHVSFNYLDRVLLQFISQETISCQRDQRELITVANEPQSGSKFFARTVAVTVYSWSINIFVGCSFAHQHDRGQNRCSLTTVE